MPEELVCSDGVPLVESSPELMTVDESMEAEASPESGIHAKRIRWFELCLILLISFGGYFFNSLYVLLAGQGIKVGPHTQSAEWAVSLVHEAASLLLLAYVLWRRRRRLRDLGMRWSFRGLGIGLAVAIVSAVGSYGAYRLGHWLISLVYHGQLSILARGITARQLYTHPSLIVFPFTIVNAFFEELIVRAFLMTEVRELTGSWILAVIASVAVQTSYHIHYGLIGALSVSFGFLVFSIYYARTRQATPLIFAHALIDFYAFLPLI